MTGPPKTLTNGFAPDLLTMAYNKKEECQKQEGIEMKRWQEGISREADR